MITVTQFGNCYGQTAHNDVHCKRQATTTAKKDKGTHRSPGTHKEARDSEKRLTSTQLSRQKQRHTWRHRLTGTHNDKHTLMNAHMDEAINPSARLQYQQPPCVGICSYCGGKVFCALSDVSTSHFVGN